MNLDQKDKEPDFQFERLFQFLDRFDCWWITDIKYDYGNSCIIQENTRIEFDNVIPINGENK